MIRWRVASGKINVDEVGLGSTLAGEPPVASSSPRDSGAPPTFVLMNEKTPLCSDELTHVLALAANALTDALARIQKNLDDGVDTDGESAKILVGE